jgi:hypothetical protein
MTDAARIARSRRPPRSYQAMPPFTEMIWPVM